MNKIVTTSYQCDKCKATFSTEKEALACEKRPITQDKRVKAGDKVIITSGDGAGQLAMVTRTYVITKDWGHYAWERYWHTVGVEADIIDSWGSRGLTFDSYKTLDNG